MVVLLFIIFFIVAALSYVEDYLGSKRTIIYVIISVILILVSGLRPLGIDNDSTNYEYYFRNYDAKEVVLLVEFSFRWLSSFFNIFTDDVRPILLLYAIIGISLKMYAIKSYSNMWFLCIAIYMGYFYIVHDMTQIRIALASGIFLLAIRPLAEHKRWTYILMICAATFFHYSSVLYLGIVFMGNSVMSKKARLIWFGLIPLGYLIHFAGANFLDMVNLPIIGEKFDLYREMSARGIFGDEINVFNMVFLVEIAIYTILLWKYDIVSQYNQYLSIMLKIMGISLFCFLVFSELPVLSFRSHEMFGIVEIILFTNIYYIIRPRWISRAFVIMIGFSLLCLTIFYNNFLKLS